MLLYITTLLTAVLHDRKGVTALEYGVLACAIIAAVGTAATVLTSDLSGLFNTIGTRLNSLPT